VGLAVAGRWRLPAWVLVLERAYTIGFETSSRNSEVIHGGSITGWQLEAAQLRRRPPTPLCYCREHGVHTPDRQLIVATSEAEISGLEKSRYRHGTESTIWNGWIGRRPSGSNRRSVALRPCCRLRRIIDSHALMLAYQAKRRRRSDGVLRTPVLSGEVRNDGLSSPSRRRADRHPLRLLVNAAGSTPGCRHGIGGVPPETIRPLISAVASISR